MGNASAQDTCSLYLAHPIDMPWVQYELAVGSSLRGSFDPLFPGTDDFCCLMPELAKISDAAEATDSVVLSVRFIIAEQRCPSSHGKLASSACASSLQLHGGLWLPSNRREAS